MMNRSFQRLLAANWVDGKFVCVDLHPDVAKLSPAADPDNLIMRIRSFVQKVVDAIGGMVAAFRTEVAFYEKFGDIGLWLLRQICQYIKQRCPNVILILDANRGGGEGASVYSADFMFDPVYEADAVLVKPYRGWDEALKSYLDHHDKGVFVIFGGADRGGMTEFENMEAAARTVGHWNVNLNCGLAPAEKADLVKQLGTVRHTAANLPLLITDIWQEGDDLRKVVSAARFRDSHGGFLISPPSDILHSNLNGLFFPKNVTAAVQKLHDQTSVIMAA